MLAGLALRRGEPATAENEVRIACEWVRPFPTCSWELLALRVRLLLVLGRPVETLGIGEAALQRFVLLGLAGYGESAWPPSPSSQGIP